MVGAALSAVGLTGVTYALVEVRSSGVVEVLPAAVVGDRLALVRARCVWTRRATDPLVPPAPAARVPGSRRRTWSRSCSTRRLAPSLLFLPLYLQFLGFSPTVAGLAFAPPSLALVLLAPRFGRIADRTRPARADRGRCVRDGVEPAPAPARADDEADAWRWGVASLVVYAVGLAAVVAPITAAALRPAPAELAGVASGLNQTVARVGGIVSVAALGALAGAVFAAAGGHGSAPFDPGLTGADREAGIDAFRVVVISVASLAAAGGVLAATLLRPPKPRSEGEEHAAPTA